MKLCFIVLSLMMIGSSSAGEIGSVKVCLKIDNSSGLVASFSSFTPTLPNDAEEDRVLRPALLRRAWMLVRKRISGREHHGRIRRALQGAKSFSKNSSFFLKFLSWNYHYKAHDECWDLQTNSHKFCSGAPSGHWLKYKWDWKNATEVKLGQIILINQSSLIIWQFRRDALYRAGKKSGP